MPLNQLEPALHIIYVGKPIEVLVIRPYHERRNQKKPPHRSVSHGVTLFTFSVGHPSLSQYITFSPLHVTRGRSFSTRDIDRPITVFLGLVEL